MKIKYYLSLLILCCLFFCTKDKKPISLIANQNDSLALYFDKANNDSVPFKIRLDYTKKAESIVSSRENDSMNRVNYFKVANRYWNISVLKDYRRVVDKLITFSISANDTLSLGKAYNYLSEYYIERSEDSAYLYIKKAENLYVGQNDKSNIYKTLLNKAMLKYSYGDYIGSQKPAYDVLRFLKMKNRTDTATEYEAYNILGYVFDELGEFSKSLEYHNKALRIAQDEFSDKRRVFTSLHNIGLLYQNNKNDKKAIRYFEEALGISNSLINTLNYGILLDNLGYSKFRLKQLEDIPEIFFESLKIADSFKSMPNQLSAKIHLSQYFSFAKDTTLAKSILTETYLVATQKQLQKYRLLSLKELIRLDLKHTRKYSDKYIEINDSLQLTERKILNKFARIEFETEELILEKDKLVSQRKTIIYASSSVVFLLISVLLIWYQRSKNREFQFVKQQQQANEQIYQLMFDQQQKLEEGKQIEKVRIAKELHDGIMGKLSSIRLNLFELEKKSDPGTIAKCVDHIREIRDVEKEIKSIAYDLRNNLFSDNISFETMVKKLFTAIEHHSDIQFQLFISPKLDWEKVSSNFKIQIYRILQESLQNIDKYAQAKNVSITMKMIEDSILIEVLDDGVGFNKKKIKRGFGLANMKERAIEMGGKVIVKSEKDKGTLISLTIPINTQS